MRRAFTLIEILIVLSIVSILMALTIPNLSNFLQLIQLNSTASEIVSELRLSQERAISTRSAYEITFEGDKYTLSKENLFTGRTETLKVKKLPKGLIFRDKRTFSFASSGFPKPQGFGTLEIQDRIGRTKAVIVNSVGRVRVE